MIIFAICQRRSDTEFWKNSNNVHIQSVFEYIWENNDTMSKHGQFPNSSSNYSMPEKKKKKKNTTGNYYAVCTNKKPLVQIYIKWFICPILRYFYKYFYNGESELE